MLTTAVTSCKNSSQTYVPQDGDIAFQISAQSDFVDAINKSSAHDDSIKFAHVGMIAILDGETSVIEAVPDRGVKITPIADFLADAVQVNGHPGVIVKRVNRAFSAKDAVERAKKFIGQDYDWCFLPDNGKMYCSELIYESILDSEGNNLFQATPMNFLDADGNMPEYWVKLFGKLDMDVPQGVPGTNPQSMSQDSILTEVYRYF